MKAQRSGSRRPTWAFEVWTPATDARKSGRSRHTRGTVCAVSCHVGHTVWGTSRNVVGGATRSKKPGLQDASTLRLARAPKANSFVQPRRPHLGMSLGHMPQRPVLHRQSRPQIRNFLAGGSRCPPCSCRISRSKILPNPDLP